MNNDNTIGAEYVGVTRQPALVDKLVKDVAAIRENKYKHVQNFGRITICTTRTKILGISNVLVNHFVSTINSYDFERGE